MTTPDKQQRIQESRYRFPYHYIPSCDDGNFVHAKVLRWGFEYLAYIRFVIERIQTLSFDSLLDVGCGDGRLLWEVRQRFPDKDLVGIDVSEQAIRFARAMSPNVEYVCGDVSDPAILAKEFDVITLIEVLEHIPPDRIQPFIRGLHKRLKANGVLVATVPSRNVKVTRKHYQHFDRESLAETLKPHLAVSHCYFINRISRWTRWMKRLLANRWFILNHRGLLNRIYRSYEKHLLPAEEHNAKRICVVCRKSGTA
jgi:2-polyprenyl-3-methyl-5-hydroxy-6-metoxy-1,4-benzoquinol methylase